MVDMTALERQLADESLRIVGPEPVVDDAAIFNAITATQSPKWRFQTMFSATKFVVAGAIVALLGGFLLSGVLTQPSGEQMPGSPLSSVPSAGCAESLAEPGVYEAINDFEGAGQEYRVVVPEGYTDAFTSPLILWLATHNGILSEQWILWSPFLDQVDAVFVLSQGRSSNHRTATTLSALIDEVSAQYCIDTRRIHAMSFSSGASVTANLACAAPERIASVMIGMGDFAGSFGCTPEASVPLVAFTSEDDDHRDATLRSVEAWAEAYGCAPETTAEDLGAGVMRHTYEDCAADIELYDIAGVGHGFVRHECLDTTLCFTNEVFDIADVAQAFFAEHPLLAE